MGNSTAVSASSSEISEAPLPTPHVALDELQVAREAILDYQSGVEAHLKSAQEEIAKAGAQTQAVRDQLIQEKTECNRWKENCAGVTAEKEALELRIQQLQQELIAQKRKSKNLHAELIEVYRDLRAEDLPTLILRVGMSLVGAQNGLFVGAQGESTLASIGLDDLPEPIAQALYAFTRQAAQSEEPVICNDSKSLPDGAALKFVA